MSTIGELSQELKVLLQPRTEQFTYFEFEIYFEHNQKSIVQISLDKLRQYSSSIFKDTDFDEIKGILNCCSGLHWLAKNNMI